MADRTTKRSRSIDRKSIGDSYLRRDYRDFLKTGDAGPTLEQQLGIAFFHYMAKRTIDKYILSGARDVDSMADCLNTIVQLAFNILVARNRREALTARELLSTGRVSYTRAWDSNGRGGRLGTERRCELGRSLILGDAAAELAARFDLTVEMTVAQLYDLRSRPDILDEILTAFESAVPLNLDYRLYLSVVAEDRTFRLVPRSKSSQTKKPAESLSGPDRLPLLGIATELGSG
jgi:hypothetical protein